MTVGVVLAAGDGRRLRPLTDKHPKPILPIPNGRTPLGVMVATLRALSIDKIVIARKDARVTVQGCEVVDVRGSGNMVHTLMAARERLLETGEDILVCYSDIIVERRVLSVVLDGVISGPQCMVCIDNDWETYYRWRFDGSTGDAETLRVEGGRITEIGRPLSTSDPLPEAQYIGLVRFSVDSLRIASSVWDEFDDPHLYMTDVLRELALRDVAVVPVPVAGGWLELDTLDDYIKVVRVLDGRELVTFFNPGGVVWDT